MSQITMQQIADDLGLSRMTVSKVVNGRAEAQKVSPDIARRVQQRMDELGYVRSRQALSLQNGQRGSVGILHVGHLFSHLVEAFNLLSNHFVDSPQNVEIVVVKPENIVEGVRELIGRGVANLIWIYPNTRLEHLRRIEPALRLLTNVKAVIYNYPFNDETWSNRLTEQGIHLVGINRRKGFYHLGLRLKELGHELAGIPDQSWEQAATGKNHISGGLQDAGLKTIGCKPDDVDWQMPDSWRDSIAPVMRKAMDKHHFTVACMGDELAIYLIRGLVDSGVRVPEDLSITGMDGLYWTQSMRPSLMTLRVPVREMVDCVEQIVAENQKAGHGGAPPAKSGGYIHQFSLELMDGESCGAPPKFVKEGDNSYLLSDAIKPYQADVPLEHKLAMN